MVVSVVVFIIVVIFAHFLNMQNNAPHRTIAVEALNPHQQLFKKVVLKTSDAIYYFRVKNGLDYQNGWVENASNSRMYGCYLSF